MKNCRPLKSIMPKFKTPEQELLARIVTQAIEDVDTLQKIENETLFTKRRNDLWGFFTSSWLYEIADVLDMDMDKPIWSELRDKIWKCTQRKPKCREKK